MATIRFSSIRNGDVLRFDSTADVLEFDDVGISAVSVSLQFRLNNSVIDFLVEGKAFVLQAIAGQLQVMDGNFVFANDSLIRLGGDSVDVVSGAVGDDNLQGFSGDDTLLGFEGDDYLNGGEGADLLSGEVGNDSLFGGAGNDVLYGYFGNDTLDGGSGDDTLDGYFGNDTYCFDVGGGHDLIYNFEWPLPEKFDVLQLGAGLTVETIKLIRDNQDLLLTTGSDADSLRVQGFFYGDATQGYQLEQIEFADGTVWSLENILVRMLAGTENDDFRVAYDTNDRLSGLGGNDTLYGYGGNDTLAGGDGADSLFGNDGNDRVEGGSGDDSLNGGADDDAIDGGSGNDTLDGDVGNDSLLGALAMTFCMVISAMIRSMVAVAMIR